MVHRLEHALRADPDHLGIEAQCLTALEDQDRLAAPSGRLAERSVPGPRVERDRGAERLGERARLLVLEIRADLCEIRAVPRRGVEVDAVRAAVDDLSHEQVCEPRAEPGNERLRSRPSGR